MGGAVIIITGNCDERHERQVLFLPFASGEPIAPDASSGVERSRIPSRVAPCWRIRLAEIEVAL